MKRTRYTRDRIKRVVRETLKAPVLSAYIVRSIELSSPVYLMEHRGAQSGYWISTKFYMAAKFRARQDAESALILFTGAEPEYLHKLEVLKINLVPTKLAWVARGEGTLEEHFKL